MGYTIVIGEAYVLHDAGELSVRVAAKRVTNENAPDHDCFVKSGNSRSPSYVTWEKFCAETGLIQLFYGGSPNAEIPTLPDSHFREEPLFKNHPGAEMLCANDLNVIRDARKRREASNKGLKPGFKHHVEGEEDLDPFLARLLWLEFWVDWALTNCAIPIIENY